MPAKLHLLRDTLEMTEFTFRCPGCACAHRIRTKGPGPCWIWNRSLEAPTFTPSLFVAPGTKRQCHSFIREGRIQFLPDSDHRLAGKTVDIPDWE
jgi:hypothetical protein